MRFVEGNSMNHFGFCYKLSAEKLRLKDILNTVMMETGRKNYTKGVRDTLETLMEVFFP